MPDLNPTIIEWARTTAGLSLDEAAAALGMSSPDRLQAIEAGEEAPSRPLLLKMSKQYRRSLLTFYLTEPPKKGDRGEDFRTLPAGQFIAADVLLDALIRDLKARQRLVRTTLEDEEEARSLAFVGSMHITDGTAAVLDEIRKTLKADLATFRACKSAGDAFAYLRACAEDIGVFVLLISNLGSHHSTIPVEAFRGFVIADQIAPFVVINDQDAKTAWSFTLLHEIVHLWLGATGVSGEYAGNAIEQFCNDVAGEFLLPTTELGSLGIGRAHDLDATVVALSEFARARNLSRTMVAYKLYRVGVITRETWRALDDKVKAMWLEDKAHQKARERTTESGPSYYVIHRHRLGRPLLEFARRNLLAGTLSPVKAARILGVKPRNVHPLLVDRPQRRGSNKEVNS